MALLLAPRILGDERGFFCETYRRETFAELGIPEEMVQDNHSRSRYGIVRGMHFQVGDGAAKLVRCARGAIFDVVIDLRVGSPMFGQWEGFELTDENMRMVYCPIGFAHGFCVTSETADVMYKQSNYYADATERGIAYNDPEVANRVAAAGRGPDPVTARRDGAAPERDRGRADVPVRGNRTARVTDVTSPPMMHSEPTHDLAIIIISTNEAHWIESLPATVFGHAGVATLEAIVVDNESTDGTRELVESVIPGARVVAPGTAAFGYGEQSWLGERERALRAVSQP